MNKILKTFIPVFCLLLFSGYLFVQIMPFLSILIAMWGGSRGRLEEAECSPAPAMTVSGCLLLLLLPLLTVQETFFEGDLLFQDTVLAQQSPELFVKGSHFRWPAGNVPYAFEELSSFSPAEKDVVRRSMDDIQDRTGCVDFVETDIARGGDIVLITKLGFGTQSGQG